MNSIRVTLSASLCVSLLCVVAPRVKAQARWRAIIQNPAVNISVDSSRMGIPGSAGSVWLKWEWTKPQVDPVKHETMASAIEKWMFDCTARRYKVVYHTGYDASGDVLSSYQAPTEAIPYLDWSETIPDSYGDAVVNRLCGR